MYFKPIQILDEDDGVIKTIEKTATTSDSDTVYFINFDSLKYPINITLPTNKSDVRISMSAWDHDKSSGDDLVRTITNLRVPFSTTTPGSTWTVGTFTTTEYTLKIRYRLLECPTHFRGLGCNFCEENYYTVKYYCDTYCKPKPGYYTCHPTTGSKVCAGKRAGVECDDCVDHFEGSNCKRCVQSYYPTESCNIQCLPNPERYNCTNEGDKQCLQYRTGSDCEDCVANHYGEDCTKFCQETTNFSCDESGEKDCKENFYPPQKCYTHCVPVTDNYTCNQTTGDKICAEEKEGEDCDECQNRNKEGVNCEKCIDNHFGKTCSKFCQETTSTSISYTCDGSGDKVCKEHYFPPQICNTHCKPVTGNYTCNQNTGERICVEEKEGEDCDECQNINKEGRNCENCIENHFGDDCSVHCNEVQGNYTCDQNTGQKECEEHYYPAQECNIYCQEVQGNYSCDPDNGEKECESGKNGRNCDECENSKIGQNCDDCRKDDYFGDNCGMYCKPDNEHYKCLKNGTRVCTDNTTSTVNQCRKPEQGSESIGGNSTPLIAGAGGGGLLLLLLVVVVIFKLRRDRNKKEDIISEGGEVDHSYRNQDQEPVYANVNKQPAVSTVNTQPVHALEDTGEVYNRIDREGQNMRQKRQPQIHHDQNQNALYSTIQSNEPGPSTDDNEGLYARLDRPEQTSKEPHNLSNEEGDNYADVTFVKNRHGGESYKQHSVKIEEEGTYADLDFVNNTLNPKHGEEPTYADVSFVRNRRGDDVVTYRNPGQGRDDGVGEPEQGGEEATYITINQLVEDKL